MKNYLICNIQDVTDVDGNILGKRVCDVSDTTFPVSDDYEWKQCADVLDVYTGAWYWADEKPNQYVPPVAVPTAEENKQNAVNKLQQTDWTTIADVADPALSNPYLTNQAEFFAWRSQIRAIAVNPTAGNLDWPVKPQEQWSN